MSGQPDPRPPRRVKAGTSDVFRAAVVRLPRRCAAYGCSNEPGSIHHVIEKGAPHFGDDVYENLVLLCGHGTAGCHGAVHGSPYVNASGVRRTTADVRAAIGRTLTLDRPDVIEYVTRKLGDAAADYLERRYSIPLRP